MLLQPYVVHTFAFIGENAKTVDFSETIKSKV